MGTSVKKLSFITFAALASFALSKPAFGSSEFANPQANHALGIKPPAEIVHKANVFGEGKVDPRSQISRDGANLVLSGVVRIVTTRPLPGFTASEGYVLPGMSSTAFMVSPCLALTNFHAIFRGTKNPTKPADYAVDVMTKLEEGGKTKVTQAIPVAWGSFSDTEVSKDWALVRLNVCLGKRTGWFEFKPLEKKNLGKKVFHLVGFPGDKSFDKLWVSKNCAIYGEYSEYGRPLLHDCSMRSGASGAPIFQVGPDGVPLVTAINSCEFNETKRIFDQYREEFANTAVSVEKILPKIRRLIEADIQETQISNPARKSSDQTKRFSL